MCFSEPALATGSEQADATCPIFTKLPALESVESPVALPALDPDQPAVILYTSGTTAHPKGVIHTHRSLYQTSVIADSWIMSSEVGETTVVLSVLPLMHAAALSGLMWSVYQGTALVLLRRFEPAAVLDSIERFGCTALACMPALWSFVVEEQARLPRCVSSLRTAVSGGDTLPVPLQERFKAIFGLDLREVYGMTESVPIMSNPLGKCGQAPLAYPRMASRCEPWT
jgi:long-chain acyl-CoA synthetase